MCYFFLIFFTASKTGTTWKMNCTYLFFHEKNNVFLRYLLRFKTITSNVFLLQNFRPFFRNTSNKSNKREKKLSRQRNQLIAMKTNDNMSILLQNSLTHTGSSSYLVANYKKVRESEFLISRSIFLL